MGRGENRTGTPSTFNFQSRLGNVVYIFVIILIRVCFSESMRGNRQQKQNPTAFQTTRIALVSSFPSALASSFRRPLDINLLEDV